MSKSGLEVGEFGGGSSSMSVPPPGCTDPAGRPRVLHHSGLDVDQSQFFVASGGVRIATWNCYVSLAPKFDAIFDLVNYLRIDVFVVQEAGVSSLARSSLVAAASRRGYRFTAFGDDLVTAGRPVSQIVVFARIACRQVSLEGLDTGGRHLVVALPRRDGPPILLAAVYGHPSNPAARDAFITQLAGALHATGRDFLAIGDWNCPDDQGAVARELANGRLHSFDDAFWGLPPTTRTGSHRRIDYGLSSLRLRATERGQYTAPGDHDLVLYSVAVLLPSQRWVPPARPRLSPDAFDPSVFARIWSQGAVDAALAGGELDLAWALLSDAAEAAFGADPLPTAGRRSQAWSPPDAGRPTLPPLHASPCAIGGYSPSTGVCASWRFIRRWRRSAPPRSVLAAL